MVLRDSGGLDFVSDFPTLRLPIRGSLLGLQTFAKSPTTPTSSILNTSVLLPMRAFQGGGGESGLKEQIRGFKCLGLVR